MSADQQAPAGEGDAPARGHHQSGNMLHTLGWTDVREVDDEGRLTLEFEVRPEFKHAGGVAQGGFVTGWLDAAMAQAAMLPVDGKAWPASLELKVSFLLPAVEGRVRATGWVVRMGRSTAFLEGRLYRDDGELLATASSTARMIWPKG